MTSARKLFEKRSFRPDLSGMLVGLLVTISARRWTIGTSTRSAVRPGEHSSSALEALSRRLLDQIGAASHVAIVTKLTARLEAGERPEIEQLLLLLRRTFSAEPARSDGAVAAAVIFYSISNCQRGLSGVSFGDFLIKQVVDELRRELPSVPTFAPLSPVPHFRRWLENCLGNEGRAALPVEARTTLAKLLAAPGLWRCDRPAAAQDALVGMAARYLLVERSETGNLLDPVARFHVGNGASLVQINPCADLSSRGIEQSLGLMVNDLYDLSRVDRNQRAFAGSGTPAASDAIRRLANGSTANPSRRSLKQDARHASGRPTARPDAISNEATPA